MKQIDAVILDMDGLMLDTEPLYKFAWQAVSAELGYMLDDRSYSKLVGRPTKDCEQELLGQFGSAFPLDRFRARWPGIWQAEVASKGVRQKPGLMEFLAVGDALGLPLPSRHQAKPTMRRSACGTPDSKGVSGSSSPATRWRAVSPLRTSIWKLWSRTGPRLTRRRHEPAARAAGHR